MKAIRKSDGKVIEVREWRGASDVVYSDPDMNRFYQASELDFNVEEAEEVTIDGWVARDKDGEIYLHRSKPKRAINLWYNELPETVALPRTSFPSLAWESEPLEVTITIKPKKQ